MSYLSIRLLPPYYLHLAWCLSFGGYLVVTGAPTWQSGTLAVCAVVTLVNIYLVRETRRLLDD